MPRIIRSRQAMPPRTPPAIAPAWEWSRFELDGEGEDVAAGIAVMVAVGASLVEAEVGRGRNLTIVLDEAFESRLVPCAGIRSTEVTNFST